jgi:hypothetical protein
MKTKDHLYAIQVITPSGKKCLAWEDKKHFYFAEKTKGFLSPEPPTLFNKRVDAKKALAGIPKKGSNLKQFSRILISKKTSIVKVKVSILN